MPGHLIGYKASPSLPALNFTNTMKRPYSPPRLPARSPIPSFKPPNDHRSAPSISSAASESASSAALAAFLEAKKGQQMTGDDFRVIETLTANMKTESAVGSPKRLDFRTGGWSAGTFSATPRTIRPLRGSNGLDSVDNTPLRPTNSFGTSGATFSLGTNTPVAGPSTSQQRRITYLGPGMSPRRMFPENKSNVKPLFDLESPNEENTPKKRRVDEETKGSDVPTRNSKIKVNGLSNSASMPDLVHENQNGLSASKGSSKGPYTPGRPSPLTANPASPRQDVVAIGKKRAADIMKELIDEEIGTVEETKEPDYMVINPYDTESSASSPAPSPSTPRSPIRSSTPQKSVLRSSLRGKEKPKRGAAAKLEAHRSGRKLTTLEILQGKRPVRRNNEIKSDTDNAQWTESSTQVRTNGEPSSRSVRIETPTQENDEMEIDPYFDRTPSQTPARQVHLAEPSPLPSPSPAPEQATSSRKIPSPEPIAPFTVPTLNSSSQPIPSYKATSSYSQTFPSPSQESALASAQKKVQPKFTPSPLSTSITPVDEDESELPRRPPVSTTKMATDPNAIYLSAKDSALTIDKAALPFFTFTLPSFPSSPSEAVRAAALKRAIEAFTFILPDPPTTSKAVPTEAKEWTCTLCSLKNPLTATEKCTICENPKPKSETPSTTSIIPKKAGPRGEGEWTCSLCMLKNPGTATEKCLICDAKRP